MEILASETKATVTIIVNIKILARNRDAIAEMYAFYIIMIVISFSVQLKLIRLIIR